MNDSKQLTPFEQQELNKLFADNPVDDTTRDICLKVYLEYKNAGNFLPERITLNLKCAFFISQKHQMLYDMKGQKIKSIGLSLNQFFKNGQLQTFMFVLKDFLKKVRIDDRQIYGQLEQTYKKLYNIKLLMSRFNKSIEKMQYPQQQYTSQMVTLAWLFFIQTKKEKQFQEGGLQSTFLLASILSFLIIYAWEYIRPRAFASYQNQDKKSIKIDVQHYILTAFTINKQSSDIYSGISSIFNNYFVELVNKKVIRMSTGKQDFLSPKYIDGNIKRLDHLYQSKLLHDDLDERLVLKQRNSNLTPSRFTPMNKQGYISKFNKTKDGKDTQTVVKLGCHRELQYDNFDRADMSTITINKQHIKQVKIPDSVFKSPTLQKKQLILHSPLTEGMKMYNYLNQKCDKYKNVSHQPLSSDSLMHSIINQVIDSTNKMNEKTKQMKITIEEYFHHYSDEIQSQQLLKGFLAVCIQLAFFVSNTPLQFEQIQNIVQSDPAHEWKACDFLIKPNQSIPASLRLHILDLEVNLISHKIFTSETLVENIKAIVNNQSLNRIKHMQRCVNRILHHLAFQTIQLSGGLSLQDSLSQQIFDVLKICLVQFTDIMANRHLDQIIICAVFFCSKKSGLSLKFMQIKQKYEQINPRSKQIHESLFSTVFLSNDETINIIEFYNKIFIDKIRPIVDRIGQMTLKQPQSQSRAPSNIPQILQSPLRSIIPNQVISKRATTNKISNTQHGQKLLYAIQQSPITRFQASFKSKSTSTLSKRFIDFNDPIIKPQQPIIKDKGLQQVNNYFQRFNKTPTISKAQKTMFCENTKPNFQKVLFERK